MFAQRRTLGWAWWHMPVVPATWEAEAGELNPGGGGCGERRLHHCTPAWVTRAKLRLKKIKNKNKKAFKEYVIIYKDI